ncbi:hypothetical protein [Flavobacterium sp. XGLA_31]|uniref:hypothetical protein n=1 Tax=Flavobacterium sp. XGLA_31 TaxID=3447666 RepID=UPI003F361ACF
MKNLKAILGLMVLVFAVSSCSSDSSSASGNMTITAKATYTNAAGKTANGVVLNSFKVNIREIEFQLAGFSGKSGGADDNGGDDNGWDDNGTFDGNDEAELHGPWELDLLNQSAPITTVTVPNGTYSEVEFKLSPSLVAASPIFGKTVEITGTINGTPFVYWNNFEQQFEIHYQDATQNLVITSGSYDLVFNFDLNQVVSAIDLSSAVDGDGDGVIEIGPNDTDGNNALATAFHEHLNDSCEMESHHH